MTGPAYLYAKAAAAERIRTAAEHTQRNQIKVEIGTDHPMRRRLGRTLIRVGQRLSPQQTELVPITRTGDC